MVDIPNNSTTTRSITVGGTLTDTLEVAGDHDWIRIELVAGQSISVSLNGLTLVDPYLRIRDGNGNLLFENDDIVSGTNRDSLLGFTAPQTGTYFIDVGAWDPPPSSPDYPGYTGTYELTVSPYSPPAVATIDQFAEQLVETYWGGSDHRFAVSQGGSLTVNLTGLTSAGQTLAREALATWTDIIGVNFVETSGTAQITFDDNEAGAHAEGIWSNGITSSASVNVSTQWLSDYGTAIGGYAFMTYIHEIGHALGLGHAGNYNGEARYPYDASFQNDGWPLSIMSYFDQQENTYFAGLGFDRAFLVTPMQADIVAMQRMYGLSTTTRTGDTTYGFNSNADRAQYNASLYPNVAYTIFDSGGNDTLDFSGFGQNQRIDLSPETFSNVGGLDGNVSIARGVTIESAVGGNGSDTLLGNGANNSLRGGAGNDTLQGNGGDDRLEGGTGLDTLSGGVGGDSFVGSSSDLNGDTITDFSAGDRIIIANASLSSFTHSISGSTLSYTGGSLTLTAFSGTLVASAAAGGGVQLTLNAATTYDVRNDFNGDGRSDLLLRHTDGTITDWLGLSNGGFAANGAVATYGLADSWQVASTGDFNGDGRDDLLLRHTDGTLTDWLGQPNGGFVSNHSAFAYGLSNSWQVAGAGDFNGDGRDDLLLRHTDGTLTDWLGQANGGFAANGAVATYALSSSWRVAGTGDFNGDGRDDLLLRHTDGTLTNWLGQANGSFISNHSALAYGLENSWQVAATGDFNGDGRDDLLLRHTDGTLTDWLGQPNGGFAANHAVATYGLSNSWQVESTGDFNGDGRDDLLLRHTDGTLTNWLGQPNGSFVSNHSALAYGLDSAWRVQPESLI